MIVLLSISLLAFLRCSNAVTLGGLCDSSNTCSEQNTHCEQQSACTKGICTCNVGFAYKVGTTGCVAEVLLGSSCGTGDYCTYGTCMSGTCQCPSGFTVSSDKRQCMGKNLGGSCSATSDCQGYYEGMLSFTVTCMSSTCQCTTGHKAYDSEVCIWHGDQESCTASSDCTPIYASCTNSKCTCQTVSGTQYVYKTGYAGHGRTVGACVHPSSQYVGYGQTCTQDVFDSTAKFCSGNLLCSQCPENYGTSIYECLNGAVHQTHVSLLFILVLIGVIAALLY